MSLRSGMMLAATVLLTIGAWLVTSRFDAQGEEEPQPLTGLAEEQLNLFLTGREAFARSYSATEGLGPLFNASSCAECHNSPGQGGSGDRGDQLVVVFGRGDGAETFDPMIAAGGPVQHRKSLKDSLPRCTLGSERVPREANVKSDRQAPALYGLGLIAAIPDQEIIAQVSYGAASDPGEVRGRPNMIDGKVGRFGLKAQSPALREMIGQELAVHLGVTNPVVPTEVAAATAPVPRACDPAADPEDPGASLSALVDFVTYLAPAARQEDSDAVSRGSRVFRSVGCAACHTPSLRTGTSPIEALNEVDVPLYSDLLLHEMGELLADSVIQGSARGSDWRTAPLWGLSSRERYLHDARTDDLREAIELHGGEALTSRNRLRRRSRGEVNDLIAFLRSL